MNGPELLEAHADRLKTRMGGCFLGERVVFRGRDLHNDLTDIDWIELYLVGITGRRFTRKQVLMLQAMWGYTSYPDARIWNNRVAALAGSARSTGALGMAAALAVSEAAIYGGGIYIPSIEFLMRARRELDGGAALADCVQKELKTRRGIAGYGRPLVSRDERIAPLMARARVLGFDDGPHVRLAHEVDAYLHAGRWRLRMNAGGLLAALAADLGLSPRDYYLFMFPVFLAGMPPCYAEATERPEGALFPLSCAHIRYEGPPKRSWPQPFPASAADGAESPFP